MKYRGLDNNKWPNKIICLGVNYHSSKNYSLPELALMIEADLLQLAGSYSELACHFETKLMAAQDGVDGLGVRLISAHSDTLMILQDEVERILESYNKQLLIRRQGRFYSYYCRFYYHIEFQHKKFRLIKGGQV